MMTIQEQCCVSGCTEPASVLLETRPLCVSHFISISYERIEQYGHEINMILALTALREAVGMTQEAFASAASMSQENVSRIERATDVKISTIRRLARTAGAQLELNAVFPNGKKVSLFRPATDLSPRSR